MIPFKSVGGEEGYFEFQPTRVVKRIDVFNGVFPLHPDYVEDGLYQEMIPAESVGKVSKMKHIDVRMAWVKELRNRNLVTFERVPGTENLADFFTKLLLGVQFTKWEAAMMQKLPLAKGA